MAIALVFGINQALLSYDLTEIGRKSPSQLIGIFVIGVLVVILIRPWSLLFFYKLLYEPNGRVLHLNYKEEGKKVPKYKVDDFGNLVRVPGSNDFIKE